MPHRQPWAGNHSLRWRSYRISRCGTLGCGALRSRATVGSDTSAQTHTPEMVWTCKGHHSAHWSSRTIARFSDMGRPPWKNVDSFHSQHCGKRLLDKGKQCKWTPQWTYACHMETCPRASTNGWNMSTLTTTQSTKQAGETHGIFTTRSGCWSRRATGCVCWNLHVGVPLTLHPQTEGNLHVNLHFGLPLFGRPSIDSQTGQIEAFFPKVQLEKVRAVTSFWLIAFRSQVFILETAGSKHRLLGWWKIGCRETIVLFWCEKNVTSFAGAAALQTF